MNRFLRILLASVAFLLLAGLVALIVFNGTYFGRERVRRMALDALRDMVNGEVIVDRIDGNLLDRFDLVGVAIVDEGERPFLLADRIRARVAIAPLLTRRIVITSIELDRPVVTLSRGLDGTWNYERIFDSGDAPTDVKLGLGSWVDLHGITINDGTLIVHQPYTSDEPRRSETRLRVERDSTGLRQTMEFRQINARIPRLLWADPDSAAVSFRVRQLSMMAGVFQAPDIVVRDLRGDVRYIGDSVALRGVNLQLPVSRIDGDLTYHVAAGDVDLDLKSDTLALAEMRPLLPQLPERGGGRVDLKATIRDTGTSEYDFRNANLIMGQSRVAGRLGMAVNPESFELRDTDLRLTRFTTELFERLVPEVDTRVSGAFTGTAKLEGTPRALRTDINGTFDPAKHAPFRITMRGLVGTGESVTARDLRVSARAVPVSLARDFVKDLPLEGTVNLDATVSGSSTRAFSGNATITHHDNGDASTIKAAGTVALADSARMDLDLQFVPVSLELVQRFFPQIDFIGDVSGLGEVHGTRRDLRAELSLWLPTGTLDVDGTFDIASEVPSYNAVVEVHDVDGQSLVESWPVTAINGVATIKGTGASTRTMDARITAHLRDAMVDSTQVGEATFAGGAREGRLTVDTLRVQTPFGVANATGTFGLTEGTEGTLNWNVDVKTLAGMQRWVATGDTTSVGLRPLVRQRMAAQVARADSLRKAADSANIGLLATRRASRREAMAASAIQASDALARDSIAGTVSARGTITGGVPRFSAQGRAALSQLVWGGNEIGRGTLDFTWADVRTPNVLLSAELGVDSVRAGGFAFDSTHAKATYRGGAGDVALEVFPGDTAAYRLRAAYTLRTDEGEVRLQDVNLHFDSTAWNSTRESVIRWRNRGLEIDSLELRSNNGKGQGRILVNGEMPDRDPGRLEVRVDSLRVAPWLTLLQSNLPVDGIATFAATIEGTRTAPTMRGSVRLARASYRATPFPEIRSEFTYGDRRLRFEGNLTQANGASQLARMKGELPVDLSLRDSVEKRTIDGPVVIDIEGDSIPLGPVAQFVDEFSVLKGEARGRIGVRGSWNQPRFEGAIVATVPELGIRVAGGTFTNGYARVHMVEDRLVVDSMIMTSGKGFVRATGAVVLEKLNHPVLDLRVVANEARVLDNARGQLVMSSNVTFKGPVDTLGVNGSLTVVHGLVRIPDPEQWRLINTGDPVLFSVADTALARELQIQPPSPLLKNADVNVRLEVRRGTWARSREANVEVYGDLAIERATGDDELKVTGALYSDYGDYELYGRRFSVTRGSVRFIGAAANPVLQLQAKHEVRQAGRAPFDIQVTIGGTLEQPNISLESRAQPTLTQSDLISFLAFGQSSTSLLQFEGSGLDAGGQSGSSLAGNVATLATRQLASVALGALFAELEADLAEQTAADVLNIKPADLPPGLTLGAVRSVAAGTQVEYGKYLDRNTFLLGTFRPTLTFPGASLERRFGQQTKARLSFEPRYLPQVPSLTSGIQPRVQQVIGALLFWTRSW